MSWGPSHGYCHTVITWSSSMKLNILHYQAYPEETSMVTAITYLIIFYETQYPSLLGLPCPHSGLWNKNDIQYVQVKDDCMCSASDEAGSLKKRVMNSRAYSLVIIRGLWPWGGKPSGLISSWTWCLLPPANGGRLHAWGTQHRHGEPQRRISSDNKPLRIT